MWGLGDYMGWGLVGYMEWGLGFWGDSVLCVLVVMGRRLLGYILLNILIHVTII